MKQLLLTFHWSALLICGCAYSIALAIKPCNYYRIGESGVCVCNTTYCDMFDIPELGCGEYVLVTTSKGGKRFHTTIGEMNVMNAAASTSSPLNGRWLTIDESQQYQKIIGFGGALTDSSSALIASMNKTLRDCVYKSYASIEHGAAYQIIRIPLGGTDFSDSPWAYNEQPTDDILLTNMTALHPLDKRRVKQIKELLELMPPLQSTLKLMLCAWSPPPWMKTNKQWHGLSFLPKQYYSLWAMYHVKVLNLWQNDGIHFWSISTGNEPITANILPFLGLSWIMNEQKQWLSAYLKPMLKRHGYNDVKILALDDQRSLLLTFCLAFQRNLFNSTLDDVDMIGVHWYFDAISDPNLTRRIAKQTPIIVTEACAGAGLNLLDLERGPKLGAWSRCQEYVQKIIDNLDDGVSAFIDWNMVLNRNGGPNYVHNFVDAPMIFDQHNQTLYKQPIFYGISHFARFLHANCTRIDSNLGWMSRISVSAMAFSCSNYTKVIIMHNRSSSPQPITITQTNNITRSHFVLDALSVNTLVYRSC